MRKPNATDLTDRAEEIFLDALDIEEPDARRIFLEQACGDNPTLLHKVLSMLDDYPKASEFFQVTSRNLTLPENFDPEVGIKEGVMIGAYRILGLLGEGGSCRVYEAEQETPVRRKVALKILKLGMDTGAVIRRFEAERQTLAMLEHPNISKVFDAGATETGRPYFVMELVHGTKITDYCQNNQLPVEERLRLMIQVCSALQHAHNKGIIHRDIKPSNILISVVDGVPIPKLIDFGIAKATDTPAGEGKTIHGQPIGTPAYMSPEQFGGGPGDVDTRSDVFSMGIVLYELLAGQAPLDNDELINEGLEVIRHRIMNAVPQRPSVHHAGKTLSFRSELDWIVMNALEKDPENRYSTVHALMADLESYLQNEPVTAHPPSSFYRLKKLLLRNRLASTAIMIAALALVAGFSISTLLYIRADSAEKEQRRLREDAEERAHVTKAAILIMQGKIEEADTEISRMARPLTNPSLEATNVFRTLAMWSADKKDWKTSADRWLAMSYVNDFDDSDMSDNVSRDLLPVAPILVMIEDFERYQSFKQFLIDRLGATSFPFAAEQLLKMCLLRPVSPAILKDLKNAENVAKNSLPQNMTQAPDDWMEAWCCVALALWHYRNGQYQDSIAWSNRSLLREDWELARLVQTRLIRALSRKATGSVNAAREDIEAARAIIKRQSVNPNEPMNGGHWHDWLIAKILLEEAEGKLN